MKFPLAKGKPVATDRWIEAYQIPVLSSCSVPVLIFINIEGILNKFIYLSKI
jgi:hypothetical protein